jgi:hypothetical protein
VDEALARARIAARRRYLEARRPAPRAARIFAVIDLKHAMVKSSAILRPAEAWPPRRAGLLFAIIVAGVTAMLHSLEVSKECQGAFSGGFSNGFDRYRLRRLRDVGRNPPRFVACRLATKHIDIKAHEEAAMRPSLFVFAICISIFCIGNRAEAQNYPWCAEYAGTPDGPVNCGFVTFEQCLATVRGVGGFCVRNNTYQPPPGPHPPTGVQRRYPY